MSLTLQDAFYKFFWHCRAKDRKSSFLCNPLPFIDIFFNSKLSETSKGPVHKFFQWHEKFSTTFLCYFFYGFPKNLHRRLVGARKLPKHQKALLRIFWYCGTKTWNSPIPFLCFTQTLVPDIRAVPTLTCSQLVSCWSERTESAPQFWISQAIRQT